MTQAKNGIQPGSVQEHDRSTHCLSFPGSCLPRTLHSQLVPTCSFQPPYPIALFSELQGQLLFSL